MPSPSRPPRLPVLGLLLCASLALLGVLVERGRAQDYSTVVRVLRESRDFRARVRAAIALGSSNDPAQARHLVGALRDDEPAVRVAAATALGRLGNADAIGPLRGLGRDRERIVREEAQRAIRRIEDARRATGPTAPSGPATVIPRTPGSDRYPSIAVLPRARDIAWPTVRYVVLMGAMHDRSDFRSGNLGAQLAREVDRNLLVLRGVAVLQQGSMPPEAEAEIRRRRLPKLRLEGTINRVERRSAGRDLSVRCEVSIMLHDEPGGALRSVLSGAATGTQPRRGAREAQERELATQVLTGAVRSAMSGAGTAIASAGRP